jgi:hypothetical protein
MSQKMKMLRKKKLNVLLIGYGSMPKHTALVHLILILNPT